MAGVWPKDTVGGLNANLLSLGWELKVSNPIKSKFSKDSLVDLKRETYNSRYHSTKAVHGVDFTENSFLGNNIRCHVSIPNVVYKKLLNPDYSPPVLVYIHGGGWCYFNIRNYNQQLQHMAKKMDTIIISPEYRLAPDSPFPAGFDDAFSVVTQLLEKRPFKFDSLEIRADSEQISISGDSAGGNISAAIAHTLATTRQDLPRIKGLALVYPVMQCVTSMVPSMKNGLIMGKKTPQENCNNLANYAGVSEKHGDAWFKDLENSHHENHAANYLFRRMDPEIYGQFIKRQKIKKFNLNNFE